MLLLVCIVYNILAFCNFVNHKDDIIYGSICIDYCLFTNMMVHYAMIIIMKIPTT